MPKCFLCNKYFDMITESHMSRQHKISCKEYAQKFSLKKGQINPNHSKSIMGAGNPRYGAILSEETRKKIRQIHKNSGRFKGKGNPMYGKPHSLETRRKISERLKISLLGEGNPFYGKKHTKETKKRLSKIRIEKRLSKGENNPLFGRGHTEETKRKQSQIRKEFNMKHPEKHINSLIVKNYRIQKKKKGGYISRKQIEIYKILRLKYSDAKLNYPIRTSAGLYFADVGIPSKKLDIEYDCWYWHNSKKDRKRDKNINRSGWNVIRLKDREIEKYNKVDLLNHIILLIKNVL